MNYSADDLLAIPLYFLRILNSYFILLLTKFEHIKEYLDITFKDNSRYAQVSSKLRDFEKSISVYDPFTLIVAMVILCVVLKLIRRVLKFIFCSLCN